MTDYQDEIDKSKDPSEGQFEDLDMDPLEGDNQEDNI
jgi:hypothetical protein